MAGYPTCTTVETNKILVRDSLANLAGIITEIEDYLGINTPKRLENEKLAAANVVSGIKETLETLSYRLQDISMTIKGL